MGFWTQLVDARASLRRAPGVSTLKAAGQRRSKFEAVVDDGCSAPTGCTVSARQASPEMRLTIGGQQHEGQLAAAGGCRA